MFVWSKNFITLSTKFLKIRKDFQRKSYITNLRGSDAIQVLRCRLNMIPIYGNYHNDITLMRLCPHCEEEAATTEHLVSCKVFHSTIAPEHLCNDTNSV